MAIRRGGTYLEEDVLFEGMQLRVVLRGQRDLQPTARHRGCVPPLVLVPRCGGKMGGIGERAARRCDDARMDGGGRKGARTSQKATVPPSPAMG